MIKILSFLLIFTSFNARAFSFSDLSDKIASFMESFLKKESLPSSLVMPQIPKVNNSAVSTETYQKVGVIYSQGVKFTKLSIEKRRSFELNFLKELFEYTKGEVVSESTLVSYLNILEQGGSREGIYRSLVLDERYSQLEAYNPNHSEKLPIAIINLSKKYLNKDYDIKQLERFNKFSLKRIFTEKFLQILDTYAFKNEPENIYSWYAFFSVDMSQHKIWKNKTRNNETLDYHYNWARNVPFEHIKSEVIIKFNKLVDHLATVK